MVACSHRNSLFFGHAWSGDREAMTIPADVLGSGCQIWLLLFEISLEDSEIARTLLKSIFSGSSKVTLRGLGFIGHGELHSCQYWPVEVVCPYNLHSSGKVHIGLLWVVLSNIFMWLPSEWFQLVSRVPNTCYWRWRTWSPEETTAAIWGWLWLCRI